MAAEKARAHRFNIVTPDKNDVLPQNLQQKCCCMTAKATHATTIPYLHPWSRPRQAPAAEEVCWLYRQYSSTNFPLFSLSTQTPWEKVVSLINECSFARGSVCVVLFFPEQAARLPSLTAGVRGGGAVYVLPAQRAVDGCLCRRAPDCCLLLSV